MLSDSDACCENTTRRKQTRHKTTAKENAMNTSRKIILAIVEGVFTIPRAIPRIIRTLAWLPALPPAPASMVRKKINAGFVSNSSSLNSSTIELKDCNINSIISTPERSNNAEQKLTSGSNGQSSECLLFSFNINKSSSFSPISMGVGGTSESSVVDTLRARMVIYSHSINQSVVSYHPGNDYFYQVSERGDWGD